MASRPLSVRFSPMQEAVIREEAARRGMAPSAYVRDCAFAHAIVARARRDSDEADWIRTADDQEALKALDATLTAWSETLRHPAARAAIDAMLRPSGEA